MRLFCLLAIATVTGSVFAQASPGRPTATVSGTVYDSIARKPVAGVTVQFVSAEDSTGGRIFTSAADATGRFSFQALPAGRYVAGFFHPALDSLGLETGGRLVEIRPGSQRVDLATPSPKTVIASVCPAAAVSDSTAVLIGHVRETESGAPIAGAGVDVEWSETVIDQLGVRERDQRVTAATGAPGWFAICGLPIDVVLYARAGHGADSSGHVGVELAGNALRHMTFHVGGAVRTAVGPIDSLNPPDSASASAPGLWRGGARLSGTVRDRGGRLVSAANAMLWGSGRQVPTNDRGSFILDGLPGGTHTLEVRVIGYVPVRTVVHLSASRPTTVEVEIGEKVAVLSTVTVRAQLVYSRQLGEFERRRRAGFGEYITPAEIERRPVTALAGLLQGTFGVNVQYSRGLATVTMRTRGRTCVPTLFVDGRKDLSGDFNFLRSDVIAAVEIYESEFGRPVEFYDRNPCGAVAVWTRPFPMKPPKKD